MQEDVLLVQQALSGDKLAFCRLIQKYYKSVYAQILSLVHNPDDTEELADDVFIKAYFNLSDLRQPAKFHTWLHHIAWNHSRNWLRQHDNNCLPLDDVYDETEANFVCDSVEDNLIYQEKLDKILEAIDTLSEMDRSLMQDFYLEEIPYETLQERYKISKPAINARLIRARKRIREQLKDLFSGIVIFSWHDIIKKAIIGGLEFMKISAKVKIVTIGVAAALVLVGTGIIILNSHKTIQDVSKPEITKQSKQTEQKTLNPTFNKIPVLGEPNKEPAKIEKASTYSEPQKKENLAKESNIVKNGENDKNKEETVSAENYEAFAQEQDMRLREFRADMIPVAEGIDTKLPKQMVEDFFDALKNRDFTKASEISGPDINLWDIYGNVYITEFTVGEPFQKEGRIYAAGKGLYVPYEIKVSNGKVSIIKKWQVALRFDSPNSNNKWRFDGGL